MRRDLPWSRGEVIGLLLILAVGAFFRFYRFDDFPGPYTLYACVGYRGRTILSLVFLGLVGLRHGWRGGLIGWDGTTDDRRHSAAP